MEYKRLDRLFCSHNEARNYLSEHPDLLIPDSKLVQSEFKVVKGSVDILLENGDTFYFVEIKHCGSLYEARKQLSRYGRMFERFSPLYKYKKLRYIVVKVQKYLGTDIYLYNNIDDVLCRTNNYSEIHKKRMIEVRKLPEVKKRYKRNWEKAMNDPKTIEKQKKGMKKYMKREKKCSNKNL